MNKRIREIAEQQGLTGPNYFIDSSELEKFAELMVRECSQYLWANEVEWTANKEDRMLQHFGVKE